MRFSLRRLLVLAFVAIVACVMVGLRWFDTAENVVRVDWLPSDASNVNYYRSYQFTAYEFDISEDGFLEWAQRWDVQPIDTPVWIWRYSLMTTETPDYKKPSLTAEEMQLAAQEHPSQRATIDDGYYYDWRSRSHGGITVAYDRSAGRAYLQRNPR